MNEAQHLLSNVALKIFKLNGQFLNLAENLARPAGLTATRWQVLGAVIDAPDTISGIARSMGITRQSVQRTSQLLAQDELIDFVDNPAHKTAKLIQLTSKGRAAIREIDPQHAKYAMALGDTLGDTKFREIAQCLERLSEAVNETET